MEPAYSAILDRRRDQMVQQIRWSSKLTKALMQEGILTKRELDKIELEKEDNRVYLLLTRLQTSTTADIFPKLCRLLHNTGNGTIAESLLFDKDRIKWSFIKDVKVTSAADFVQILDEELLTPAIGDQDIYRRTAKLNEAKRRLKTLFEHMKTQNQLEDAFKSNLVDIHKTREVENLWKDACKRAKSLRSFEQMSKDTGIVNEKVQSHLMQVTTRLQEENDKLNGQVKKLEASLKKLENDVPVVLARPYTEDKKLAHLQKTLAKQDQSYIQLKTETQSEMKDSYRISKDGLHSILSTLHAYTKRASNGLGGDGSDVTAILQDEVEGLVEQLQRMKSRTQQAAGHSSELEQERGMALALLKVRPGAKDVKLQAVLRTKLDELNAEIKKLTAENGNLMKQIRGLEKDNDDITEKYKDLQAKLSDFACASSSGPSKKPIAQSQYTRSWRP